MRSMIRSFANSRCLASLALAAAMLLALAPAISRVIASADPAGQSIPMALCTSADAHSVDAAAPGASQDKFPGPMAAWTGDACGYCALLSPPLPSLPTLLAGMPPASGATTLRLSSPIQGWPRNLRGLGSQAPPSAA
jgi:hypothetical protein